MSVALAEWSPGDLEQLATLCHRLADDFFDHAEDEIDLAPEVRGKA
ncbi:hypothetical protein ACFXKC_11745 [Streptomyces sp. NPDC059340]